MDSSSKRLSDRDWLSHKAEIEDMLLKQGFTTDQTIEALKTRGLHANKKQLNYRLEKWKIRRRLERGKSAAGWQYIAHQVSRRRNQGKESLVLRNGTIVDQQTIDKEIGRYQPSCHQMILQGPVSPRSPEGVQISVCTPIPLWTQSPWPENLPWFRFCSALTIYVPATMANNATDATMALGGMIRSTDRTFGRNIFLTPNVWDMFSISNVSEFASTLYSFMPETSEAEHFRRAQRIVKGPSNHRLEEYLRIILFRLTNGFLPGDIGNTWPIILLLLAVSGIMKAPLKLRGTTNITAAAFAESLFKMAFKFISVAYTPAVRLEPNGLDIEESVTKTQTVVKWLLLSGQDPNTIPSEGQRSIETGLATAVRYQRVDLALMLLEAGAKPDVSKGLNKGHGGEVQYRVTSPLVKAIRGRDYERRDCLIKRLLMAGADPNAIDQSTALTPLMAAVGSNDFITTTTLVQWGAQITRQVCLGPWDTELQEKMLSSNHNALAHAASASSESTALRMIEHLLEILQQKDDPRELRGAVIFTESFIVAASKGYNEFLTLLLNKGVHPAVTTDMGFSALHAAAYQGHLQTCKMLLARGVPVESSMDYPNTPSPLHLAAAGCHFHVVELLHKLGADINHNIKADYNNMPCRIFDSKARFPKYISEWRRKAFASPFATAIIANNQDTYKYLALNGAAISDWALHYGADIKDPSLVSFLLERGAKIGSLGVDERTPLEAALSMDKDHDPNHRRSSIAIANMFLDYGVTIFEGAAIKAAYFGDKHLLERILSRGSDKIATIPNGFTLLDDEVPAFALSLIEEVLKLIPGAYDGSSLRIATELAGTNGGTRLVAELLKSRPPCETAHDQEKNAVAIASWRENIPLLNLLLENLPVPQTLDFSARPIYHYPAVNHPRYLKQHLFFEKPSHVDTIIEISLLLFTFNSPRARSLLLTHGYKPNRNTLGFAVQFGNLALVKELWPHYHSILSPYVVISNQYKAANGQRHQAERHLLYEAIAKQDIDMTRFLIEEREDVNFDESNIDFGRTPVQIAAEVGNLPIFDLLLENGANIDAPAAYDGGATALQAACIYGNLGIAKILLDLGANANAPRATMSGRTALEGAAEHGRIDTIQLLLSRGANTMGQGRLQYIRAIILAERRGHHAAAKLLRSHREWTTKDHSLFSLSQGILDPYIYDDSFEKSLGEDASIAEVDIDWVARFQEIYTNDYDSDEETEASSDDETNFDSEEDLDHREDEYEPDVMEDVSAEDHIGIRGLGDDHVELVNGQSSSTGGTADGTGNDELWDFIGRLGDASDGSDDANLMELF